MTIRSKAVFGVAFSLLVMAVAVSIHLVTYVRLRGTEETEAGLHRIVRGAFALNALASEYVLHASPRIRHQWTLKHDDVSAEIGRLRVATPDEEVLLDNLRAVQEETGGHFNDLGELSEAQDMDIARESLHAELRQRMGGQLGTGLQTVISLSSQLSDAVRERRRTLMDLQSRVALGCVVALAGALTVMSVLTVWTIVRPLRRLQHDIRAIGKGNLKHRVADDRDDEIGELGMAFNHMTASLQQVTASRDELDDEIRQRIQAEDKLRKTLKNLERSNEQLEQFAYVASHDLQEPLRKVTAFGDRLEMKCGDVLTDQCRDYLARMLNAASRMQRLINDLLTFSRVTTRAKPFMTTDLNMIARDVLSDLETRIREVAGTVELGRLPVLDADPMQMRQLLQNLIGNGLKYHRKDVPPVVTVESTAVTSSDAMPGGEAVEIEFNDNGIGFDAKYKDRIFGVFQRLHGRGEYEGTGIGLAICRKIVERHNGKIEVRSTPGEGTAFTVRLPLTQVPPEEEQADDDIDPLE